MINKKRKGFTLPEILAVVAILILLVGIAVPGYERLTQKSDVSDALHNLEMLSSAQSKYFISNGNYTRNLNALQTPLKSKDGGDNASITTTNFTYSAGSVLHSVGHEQFCVFSESNKNGYVLAYNYKTNVGPICSGSFCPEISNIVPEGSISELCGGEYNSTCDLTCTSPFVLNKKECACVCGNQCGAYSEQSGDCSCHCIGQATMGVSGCQCPAYVASDCEKAGLKFSSEKCDCVSCDLTEEFCNSMKKVLDVSNCQCVEPANPNAFCDLACPAGKVLDEDNCVCKCAKTAKCLGEKQFNNDTCQCECPKSVTCPSNKIFNKEKCSCDCNPSLCPSPYQSLNSDCSCACNAPPSSEQFCEGNKVWNSSACDCVCNLKQSDCPPGKFLNSEKCVCEGTCALTDADCQEGYIVNDKCQCVESECIFHPETCFDGNGHWDYRDCECKCNLTQEYCHDNGNKVLDPKTCQCTGCSTIEKECLEHNKILDGSTCQCRCSDETQTYCSRTPYLELQENNDCACVCNTPAAGTCKGHSFFNSSVETCNCECGYACSDPWKLNESQCKCECSLDAAKCTAKNKNYGFRTSGEEVCECYCTLDLAKCQAKNPNYTFTGNESCGCTCGKTDAICQTESGNQYYGVNNETSCQCACSSTLLEEGVSARNAANAQSGHKGPFFQSNLASCSITCPVTGDTWCKEHYGEDYLADTTHCTCYKSPCAAQTCYNNNGNGHWDYRNCQCQCDINATYCTQQGKVFDPDRCECRNACTLSTQACQNKNPNYVFNSSPYDDCSCSCGLSNTQCNSDHGKILDNQTSCQCVCPTISLGSHQVQNSTTCQPECDNLACTGNWTKDPPTTCTCTVCPNSVSSSCFSQGKEYDSSICDCPDCSPGDCPGQSTQNADTCSCECNLTDGKCATQKGNSNWKANTNVLVCECECGISDSNCPANKTVNSSSCLCECNHGLVDTAVQNKKNETGSNNWVADYSSGVCGPSCPSSVEANCLAQHKDYNEATCSCGNTCNNTCTAGTSLKPNPANSCACECDLTALSAAVSASEGGSTYWQGNTTTCKPECKVTNDAWCRANRGANYVKGPGCSCVCGNDATCASNHSGNANWKMNGSCGCECSLNPGDCQTLHSNLNYMVNSNCECVCNTNASCGTGKHLNTGTCQCECNTQLECGPNKDEDPTTCGCGECKLTSCPAGKVLVETETGCYCDDSCKVNCTSPKVKQEEPCGCVCADYLAFGGRVNSCPDGTAPMDNCTCECSSSCASPKEMDNNSCNCVCPYYTVAGDATHYDSCPANFTTNNSNCTCSCDRNCKSGETLNNETCTCSCDKSPYGNFIVDSNCEYQCSASLLETAVQNKNNETGSSYWTAGSNCEPTCNVSGLQSYCDGLNRYYNESTCTCGACKSTLECAGQAEPDGSASACGCACNLTNGDCAIQKGNSNWKANTNVLVCECECGISDSNCPANKTVNSSSCLCECNHGLVDTAVQNKKKQTGSNYWIPDYTSAVCGPKCDETSLSSYCSGLGKGYDIATCTCTTCINDCPYPGLTQHESDCSCHCDNPPSCTNPLELNETKCACECNTSSLASTCANQNRQPKNDGSCTCGSCITDACDGYWTRNTSSCGCTDCNLDDETCHNDSGANYVANNSAGHCECQCSIGSDSDCATLHGGNTNWIKNGCGCQCSVNEGVCEGQGKVYNSATCACDCPEDECDGNWEFNSNTCQCDICNLSCTSPKALNSRKCVCECANNSCPGNWNVNQSTCECTECNLTDTQCQQMNSNSNYVANNSDCSCECGLTGCLGNNELIGCECVCPNRDVQKEECETRVDRQFNDLLCRCEEKPVTTECAMPMADTGQGYCSCSPFAASYCAGLGLELAYGGKVKGGIECYCEEPSSGCQSPWVSCGSVESYTGCCCGIDESTCTKQGKVLNSTICACVQASSAQCTGNFVQVGNECVCGLSEDECRKQGLTLFTQGRARCECVPIDSNICEWPWVQNGKYCRCGLTEEDCQSPRILINSTSTCRCNCPLTIYDCPESTYPDLTSCTCVPLNLCPNFYDQNCYNGNGHFDFTACSCVCDIDSYYCAHAFPQPRYFDPVSCRCLTYAI